MWIFLLSALAFAGDIVIDAEVPVEVALDGRPVAQVFYPSSVRFQASEGEHTVTIMQGASPSKIVLDVPEKGAARVVVGKTGISTTDDAAPEVADEAKVEFRLMGKEGLRLVVGEQRFKMGVDAKQALELSRGSHEVQVRSFNGTVIYAVGNLEVAGTGDVVVHVSAGRAPEVVGTTGRWHAEER